MSVVEAEIFLLFFTHLRNSLAHNAITCFRTYCLSAQLFISSFYSCAFTERYGMTVSVYVRNLCS